MFADINNNNISSFLLDYTIDLLVAIKVFLVYTNCYVEVIILLYYNLLYRLEI